MKKSYHFRFANPIASPRERDAGALALDFWLDGRSVAEVADTNHLDFLCFLSLPASASAFIAIALPGAPTIVTSFLARHHGIGFASQRADDFSVWLRLPDFATPWHHESWTMAYVSIPWDFFLNVPRSTMSLTPSILHPSSS